jgi:hypothetical protein
LEDDERGMRQATDNDHVEGVTDPTFYAEAQEIERDIRGRLRNRTPRYRVLLLRRVLAVIEAKHFQKRRRRIPGPTRFHLASHPTASLP